MSSALSHKRREAACYSSHVSKRGYKALTRECRPGEYAELRQLRTNMQFNSTAYIWISANSVKIIPQLSIHRFRPIIYNSFIGTAGKNRMIITRETEVVLNLLSHHAGIQRNRSKATFSQFCYNFSKNTLFKLERYNVLLRSNYDPRGQVLFTLTNLKLR